ncbi:S41 family peptidase [Micromonospora sp. CPCC 206061]
MSGQLDMVARAEQLSRSQHWQQAALEWQAVVAVNPVNGVYWDRLAEARFSTGDYAGALTAYQRAEALGVWPVRGPERVPITSIFPGEIAYRIASCHALLGDTDEALAALARAVRQQLRDLDRAATDTHLASLHDDPRFRDLLGAGGHGAALSRVDGWRADLRTLRREIDRRIPFREVVDAAFAAAVANLDRAIPDLDDARIVVEMWRLLRRLGDGHARIDTSQAFPDWSRCLPIWFFLFDEGLFIPQAEPRYESLLGAQVMAIDGRPVPKVVDALDPLLTRDNDYGPMANAPIWMRQPAFLHAVDVADDPSVLTLTVRLAGGGVRDVTVAAEAAPKPHPWPSWCTPTSLRFTGGTHGPAYLRDVDNRYWFEYLPAENLVYFQFNSIGDKPDEPLAAFYQRMFTAIDDHDAATLVVDLRWNGGGNTFLAEPLVHHIIRRERINRHGGLFVIIGRNTFSAAQNTTTFLDRHTRAVFVGEPTGSRPNFVGETVPFRLPYSAIEVNVSDLYWQTSWPTDRRTAIAPDIYAPPTFAAYRANRDPAMDAILTQLGSDHHEPEPDPVSAQPDPAGDPADGRRRAGPVPPAVREDRH